MSDYSEEAKAARFTPEQNQEILAAKLSRKDLAAKFGLHPRQIQRQRAWLTRTKEAK